ncbi:Translocase subunit seca [Quillaja saponaria]|uniref:Translocase subunit seca n=1 Tax=Quillaja saponaria TaxID=32244 RepID=A0AAD7PXX3_QUISA|nr:Translocase subunit seca [Quillaja saponaria]
MDHYNPQKNAFISCEEMRGNVYVSDPKDPLICPKPRRVGVLANTPMRPLRWHPSHQAEIYDSKAGAELLDIILMKEGYGEQQCANQVALSPPYFCGSPPSRAANPLVKDAQFGNEKLTPISTSAIPSPSALSSPSSASRKGGGCVRMKFGQKPAAVRVEGFDCLNRDRQNSSIPAVA